jgi:UDP-3-O-[3-hydroxymyristoyl] glucosamine N-acyltransferase
MSRLVRTRNADGVCIHPHATVYEEVNIGRDTVIHSGVALRERTIVGERVIIHNNAVIGCDGFGFAKDEDRRWLKIPQAGRVVIEYDVEIGAGTTIDRASIGESRIGRGSKLDNLSDWLVCTVGEDSLLCAQVTRPEVHIGNRVTRRTGRGRGHLTIGDDVVLQQRVHSHATLAGKIILESCLSTIDWLRATAAYRRLK